jgi:hypothetical protein
MREVRGLRDLRALRETREIRGMREMRGMITYSHLHPDFDSVCAVYTQPINNQKYTFFTLRVV